MALTTCSERATVLLPLSLTFHLASDSRESFCRTPTCSTAVRRVIVCERGGPSSQLSAVPAHFHCSYASNATARIVALGWPRRSPWNCNTLPLDSMDWSTVAPILCHRSWCLAMCNWSAVTVHRSFDTPNCLPALDSGSSWPTELDPVTDDCLRCPIDILFG